MIVIATIVIVVICCICHRRKRKRLTSRPTVLARLSFSSTSRPGDVTSRPSDVSLPPSYGSFSTTFVSFFKSIREIKIERINIWALECDIYKYFRFISQLCFSIFLSFAEMSTRRAEPAEVYGAFPAEIISQPPSYEEAVGTPPPPLCHVHPAQAQRQGSPGVHGLK